MCVCVCVCVLQVKCLFGSDPFHGNATTTVAASILSPTRLLCRSPAFGGAFYYGKRPVPVHVTINGDEWARTAPCEHCNFSYYDERAARITAVRVAMEHRLHLGLDSVSIN